MRPHERINPASTSITSLHFQSVVKELDNALGSNCRMSTNRLRQLPDPLLAKRWSMFENKGIEFYDVVINFYPPLCYRSLLARLLAPLRRAAPIITPSGLVRPYQQNAKLSV
jgi:hypothetical protein